MSAVLSCQQLSVSLSLNQQRYEVIHQLDLCLQKGKTFAIVGESGCGKSMTALALNQLLPEVGAYYRESIVEFDGHNLLELSEVEMQSIRGKRIAMIFQEPMTALNPVLTIGQQLTETLKKHKNDKGSTLKAAALDLLQAVGIPEPKQRFNEYPHQLSGGMKQRVVIAIAIALRPDVLIADEPTTALDVTIQAQILELLQQLQQDTGMAILLISHDLGVVSQMADDVAVMYAGQFVETGSVENIIQSPKHPYTQQLLAAVPSLDLQHQALSMISGNVPSLTEAKAPCPFAPRCQSAWQTCYDNRPMLKVIEPQHQVACHLYSKQARTQQPMTNDEPLRSPTSTKKNEVALRVQDLYCHFPIKKGLLQHTIATVKAVDGVSLTLYKGKTLALVGESGCGKTSLGKTISLLQQPTAGDIYLDEEVVFSLKHTHDLSLLRQQLQMIFQDPFSSLNPRMMVAQLLSEGLTARGLYKNKDERNAFLIELLDMVGLPQDILQRYPHEFSGGQRQRLSVARALAVNPKIIICDEPTSALDLSVQAKILNLLKALQAKHDLAYLFITHDISVVSYMADEIAVMYLGRIVEQGTVTEILNTPKHPYTIALLKAVPIIGKQQTKVLALHGEQPSPVNQPKGCHFASRCAKAMPQCREQYPQQSQLSDSHKVHCFLYSTH